VIGALSVIKRAKQTGSTRRAWLVTLKLALFLHDLLGSFDLCQYVLMELDRRGGEALAPGYRQRLIHGATA